MLLTFKKQETKFFSKNKNATVHLQLDNTSALTYLLKTGVTQNLEMIKISKESWMYLLSRNISITGEHLRSKLNYLAE